VKLRPALAFAILPIIILLTVLQGGALLTRSYMSEASLQAGLHCALQWRHLPAISVGMNHCPR
jgi:hypothetical protein